MHVLMLTAIGLIVLGAFALATPLVGRTRADGARLFIWIWLAASLVNACVGVFAAGIPIINEIGAFIIIFGVPAAIAWLLSRKPAVAA